MNRRDVLIGLAAAGIPLPAVVRAQIEAERRICVSGADRWRSGSQIVIGFCAADSFEVQAALAAVTNWNGVFGGLVNQILVSCVSPGQAGGIAIVRDRCLAAGVPHHGKVIQVLRDKDGYINHVTLGINTIDYGTDAGRNSSLYCHEIGHALGRGHDPEWYGGCMARAAEGGAVAGDPNYPGYQTVVDMYAVYNQPEVCRRK